jgi:hypothetical protein
MKTEVYSWRVARDLKSELEDEARRRKSSVSSILNQAVREWLDKSGEDVGSDEAQRRLRQAVSKCFGAFAGGDSHRSENARKAVRQRLRGRHGR